MVQGDRAMRVSDRQLGAPSVLYKGAKATIEALAGMEAGAIAYATDTLLFGTYNGSAWVWGGGGTAVSGEVLVQDGITAPPVPIETEAQDDWLYEG
jgi:hypothetical protein